MSQNIVHAQRNLHVLLLSLGIVVWGILVIIGFYLLIISKTDVRLFSPWQTIHPAYIYVFFVSIIVLGFLTLSRLNHKIILFLLIIQTLLMHSFLPLTHEFFYGADNWRHIATEERLLHNEGRIQPKIADVSQQSFVQGLHLDEVSYWGFQWLTVGVTKVFHTDLVTVNKWLGPIIWSVVFPLLLFQIGITLGWSKRRSLVFAWLGFLPFAWIAGGSWTLPNNLTFLWYLAMAIVLLRRLKKPEKWQVAFLIVMGMVSIFGYVLYAILFWGSWMAVEILRYMATPPSLPFPRGGSKTSSSLLSNKSIGENRQQDSKLKIIILGIIGAFIIPVIELIAGYSHFDPHHNFLGSIKVLFKSIIGWFIARGPYPYDITAWNIVFNQLPQQAFVSNIFIMWRWWLLPVIIGLTTISLCGWWQTLRSKEKILQWFGVLYIGLFGSYIGSRYFLTGENILVRRLDLVLALLIMVTLYIGLQRIWEKIKMRYSKKSMSGFIGIGIVFFSILIATSYSLGPDTNVVTGEEYRAMQMVWSEIKDTPDRCVLADTYPLVALEAISHREIIGGGFPINQYFAQPERVQLLTALSMNAQEMTWEVALKDYSNWNKVNAKSCWLVVDKSRLEASGLTRLWHSRMHPLGNVIMWKYIKK